MSLSDYIRYQRARKGGLTPWEIAEETGISAGEIHLLEVKHRRVGEDDATLEKLAAYFGVPLEELTGRREAYRKRLVAFLDERARDGEPIALRLEDGELLSGTVAWYSREALALAADDGGDPYIVQRAWIADWRLNSNGRWEIASL